MDRSYQSRGRRKGGVHRQRLSDEWLKGRPCRVKFKGEKSASRERLAPKEGGVWGGENRVSRRDKLQEKRRNYAAAGVLDPTDEWGSRPLYFFQARSGEGRMLRRIFS